MTLYLGKLPPDPSRPALRLTPHIDPTAVLPAPPAADWLSHVDGWPMYGNNAWGDCVWAMIGHAIQAWTEYVTGQDVEVTLAALLKGYSDVTGFDPNAGPPGNNPTDQGTVLQDALDYWRKTGIGGHKVVAFAKVDHTDKAEVEAAIAYFGALLIGISFPDTAMQQFDAGEPWDVVAGAHLEGGHAIHGGAYIDADGMLTITTWGRTQKMTWAFWRAYCDEAWVAITQDWIDAEGHTPSGLDAYGLGQDFTALTGAPNPFPPPVDPPGPPVDPPPVAGPDAVLWGKVRRWATARHLSWFGAAATAKALRKWASDKGLAARGDIPE